MRESRKERKGERGKVWGNVGMIREESSKGEYKRSGLAGGRKYEIISNLGRFL